MFGFIALIAILLMIGACLWFYTSFQRLGPLDKETVLIIPKGVSSARIAADLEAAGIIADSRVFRLGLKFLSRNMPLRAGEFLFPAQVSPFNAIHLLQSGQTVARYFTAPEGLSNAKIVASLIKTPGMTGSVGQLPQEGWLLPETYHFSFGDPRYRLIEQMNKAMVNLLDELWERRTADLPFKSPDEALILASIVEKETGIAAERARIAAVFINRMRKDMRLQSDPTVVYGLTLGRHELGRALTHNDLRHATPYNTYLIKRLPPTPIANPGRAALNAVFNPVISDELYFVADGTGGHVFAGTFKEHKVNVTRWRNLQRKKRFAKD